MGYTPEEYWAILEVHRRYASAFSVDFGVDYYAAQDKYLDLAPSLGVFPDVGYLLYALASSSSTHNILEFGSGWSTVVLALAATKAGKSLCTLESLPKWANIVRGLLKTYGISPRLYCGADCVSYKPPANIDLLWVDGPIGPAIPTDDKLALRIKACEQYEDYLSGATIAFDDAQWIADDIKALLLRFGRTPTSFCWYNPANRKDRHILLSFPDSPLGLEHRGLVSECALI